MTNSGGTGVSKFADLGKGKKVRDITFVNITINNYLFLWHVNVSNTN